MISRIHLVVLAKNYFTRELGRLPERLTELLEQFGMGLITREVLRNELFKLKDFGITVDLVEGSFPEITPFFG